MKFAPLNIQSGYSFLQSGLTVDSIVKIVKKNDYFGAAISDLNVMHGLPLFAKEMEKNQKPYIFGVRLIILNQEICLYVTHEEGYKTLCYISAFIDEEDKVIEYLKKHKFGLIGILSTTNKETRNLLISLNRETRDLLITLSSLFEKFYIGLDTQTKEDIKDSNIIKNNVTNFTYNTIAFPLIKYVKKSDAIALTIVDAISKDLNIQTKEENGNLYFKTEEEINELYDQDDILETIKLFDSVTFNYHQKRGEILSFNVSSSNDYLKNECYKSLKEKNLENETYIARLEHELNIIKEMGYSDYFLIVSDYVKYANSVGILTGPGRGSAAGSLVSYLMHITKIDPLKYDLLFERFLNPARKKMPDIDIDFMDTRRDEVINYLRNKYGNDKVANIITFSTILAKQSLRDIGRIYNKPTRDIDLLSSRLKNYNLSLRDSYRKIDGFKQIIDSDKYYLDIVSLASKIENLPRQSGLHAAGIVLNNTSLQQSLPVIKDFDNNYITQYEMDYLEEQGFLKMDLLGLRNLTIISNCVDLINENHKDANIDKFNVPFDTKEVYELISSNMTMGLFQLESSGMKNAIKQLKPSCFNDVVALLALFRPGPMASIPIYAKRKEGKEKPVYISDDLKDILKETYGIIVYQEQIIQIARKMAKFSLAKADNFRNAISKKNIKEIEQVKNDFIQGSINNGYTLKTATNVYEHILKFANYGFNKSHSVGYSMIACQMGYLKANYPLEFYASILRMGASSSDSKFNDYVTEMKHRGIKLYLPSINESTNEFEIKNNGLILPLNMIKGVPSQVMFNIVKERNNNGHYIDFLDFVSRNKQYGITALQIQKIILSGAFDCFNHSRTSLIRYIPSAIQYADVVTDKNGQLTLGFETFEKPVLKEEMDDPLEKLALEYETIGIMLSNNPLSYKKDLIENIHALSISDAKNERNCLTVGIIRSVKTIMNKKGQEMAFVKLFDETDEIEITIFQDTYKECFDLLKKNNIIIAKIKENIHQDNKTYIAENIKLLEE